MKRAICLFLVVIVAAAALVACGQKTDQLSRIDTGNVKHVTITDSPTSEKVNDIIRRKGIVQLVEIYNTMRFVETDEATADELLNDTLYSFRFYDYSEKMIGECEVSPEGYLMKDGDRETVYKLTTDFDENVVLECIKLYEKLSVVP